MNNEQHNINPLPPSNEEQAIVQQRKDKLPKLDIAKGEPLYVSREQLAELHEAFYDLMSDMAQASGLPAEMRSVMEDAAYHSYLDEIAKLRRENKLEYDVDWLRVEMLNSTLTPRSWRGWLFRRKRNRAQVLLDELVARQSWEYMKRKEQELPTSDEAEGIEYTPYTVLIEELKELLPRRMRKKKRAVWEAMIEELSASYESKANELKRCAVELGEVQQQLEEAKHHVEELEQTVEQLVNESEEVAEGEEESERGEGAPEDADKESENEEETPEEISGGEGEVAETADVEEAEDLEYGELLESDESEGGGE